MKEKNLFFIWAILYIACAMLGLRADPQGFEKIAVIAVSVLFFIPGFMIVLDAVKADNRKTLRIIRIISILSLSLTSIMLVVNTLSVTYSETVGKVMHIILLIVSAPMFSMQYWGISLFLWACLLMLSIPDKKKKA